MDLGLTDSVVLVTGSSRGIGRSTAVAFAREGARVVVTYRTRTDLAHEVVTQIETAGGQAWAAPFDLGSEDSIRQVVRKALDKWGRVDVLVNNAAEIPPISPVPFEEVEVEQWRAPLRANVEGTYSLIQAVVPSMRASGRGRIVNVSAIFAVDGFPGAGAYAAGKAALHGLTRVLAKELGPAGILVNTVMPGLTLTDLGLRLPEAYRAERAQASPVRRLLSPDDIAPAIVFLGSPANTSITGEIIRTSGGSSVVDTPARVAG